MELDIGNHPGRMVNLRYCLGDEILKLKRLATTHINRDEKIAFRFDPLPNKLCFLADCMFPVKPVIISVFYRSVPAAPNLRNSTFEKRSCETEGPWNVVDSVKM